MPTPIDEIRQAPEAEPDPFANLEGPPEEAFWERYNRRLEFPLSTSAAVLLHVLVGTLVIYALFQLAKLSPDKSSIPVKLVNITGLDAEGEGSLGSGGGDPLVDGQSNPLKHNPNSLPDPAMLPQVTKDFKKIVFDDPNADVPISPQNAAAYAALDKSLTEKLNGIGGRKGDGSEAGKGSDGSKGTGPGGTGANSSRARSLRWVMRFRTLSGEDYVAQLAAMGAVILVPLPPENEKCLYFTDLKNLAARKMATDDDLKGLAGQIKFSDTRENSVGAVCSALGVREPAKSFWAFFPKGLEEDLARKETGYRNRQADAIEETIFRVIVRGGSYEIVVDDQTAKR